MQFCFSHKKEIFRTYKSLLQTSSVEKVYKVLRLSVRMKKAKIYATGNERITGDFNLSYYIFEKDESFLDWLGLLLEDVMEIENGRDQAKLIIQDAEREKGGFIEQTVYAKEIKKMIDVHESYQNKRNQVDIFYGKDRVYLTFRKSRETRLKFTKFLRKTKDWIVISEVQKIPVYAQKVA